MPAKKRVPKYCLQKSSGLAYVKIDGRRHYLGKHGSEDSKARYRELVNEWETRIDPEAPVDLTIGELALLYVEHAKRYYVKDGRQTSEVQCITAAVRFLMPWRTLHVSRFNPRMLKAARDEMVRADPDAFVFRPTSASDRSYHKQAVRKAVWRAVESENAKREAEGEPLIADWHPHQLRHTAARRFRREHGVEIAKSVLGHAKVEMTELYAERDLTAARAVIAKIG